MTNIITLTNGKSLYNTNRNVQAKVLRRFSMFDGCGLDLTGCENYNQALEEAGLDYTAECKKTYLENGKEIPNSYAVVKTTGENEILGVVGAQYVPVSNREAFDVADELVNEGYARYEVGGPSLGAKNHVDFAKSFLVLRGDDFKVGDDIYNNFTIFNNSFDGSSGVNYQVIAQRVWCLNGAVRYLGGKASQLRINIQHSKTAPDRIKIARSIVMKRQEDIRMIQREAEAFIGTKYTKQEFEKKIIPHVLESLKLVEKDKERERGHERVERVVDQLMMAYNSDDVQNYAGTAFRVILALQDWETHAEPLRSTGNNSVYLNRITKGMLTTAAVAQYIANTKNFNMAQFRG